MATFVWTNTMNDACSLKNTCRISGLVCKVTTFWAKKERKGLKMERKDLKNLKKFHLIVYY